nr:hypothetical protein Itr_chr13CG12510 [Ipomoea trifida]
MSQPGFFDSTCVSALAALFLSLMSKRSGEDVPIPKSQDLRWGSVDPPTASSLEAETGLQHRRSGAKEEDVDESPAALLWRAPYSPFPTGFSISGREQSDDAKEEEDGYGDDLAN